MPLGIRNAFATVRNAFDHECARDFKRSAFTLKAQRHAKKNAEPGAKRDTSSAVFHGREPGYLAPIAAWSIVARARKIAEREALEVTWDQGDRAFGGACLGFPFAVVPVRNDPDAFRVVVARDLAALTTELVAYLAGWGDPFAPETAAK